MPSPLTSSDTTFRFRSFGAEPLTLENLREEVEAMYEFLDDKLKGLHGENSLALAQLESSLGEDISANTSLIYEATTSEDEALATRIETLEASFTSQTGEFNARIENLALAFASADQALAVQTSTLEASFNGTITVLQGEVDANATAISSLTASVATNTSGISVNASAITALDVRLTAAEGGVTANASAVSALDVRVTANESGITSNASSITALDSRLTTAEGGVSGNATAISGLDTRVTAAEGNITANASSITTLTASVGTNTASISTNASAIVAVQGDITTIEAQWGVAVDINGRVVGRINLNGTNQTSTLDFAADNINFYDGSATFKPFSITANDGQASLTASRSIFGNSIAQHFEFVSSSAGYTVLNAYANAVEVGTFRPVFNGIYPGVEGYLRLQNTANSDETVLNSNNITTQRVNTDNLRITGGQIEKSVNDGWTPLLEDGDNTIEFRWDSSSLQVRIDQTTIKTITIT